MKKQLLITSLICFLIAGMASLGFAQEADNEIAQTIEIPDATKWVLDTEKRLWITETYEVTWRQIDSNGDPTGEEITVTFRNVEDDISTPEDETETDFTDVNNYLKNRMAAGDSYILALKKACKIKLGLN